MGEITFRGGVAQQATYADYGVARMRDTPAIEVHIVPSEATQPFGMGEPPVPPIAPAIVNAIFAATGKRIRRLPIRAGRCEVVMVASARRRKQPSRPARPVISNLACEPRPALNLTSL